MYHLDDGPRTHWRVKPAYRWRWIWLGLLAMLIVAKIWVG
jgi:hypothetical protein